MIPFREELRYNYQLTPGSVVMDVGAHIGNWSNTICEKYDCHALAFEPIHEFAVQSIAKLAKYPKARVFNLGIGGTTRQETWKIHGCMTGITSDGEIEEQVNIRSIVDVIEEFGIGKFIPRIAVLKINAEGSEYEILESILDNELTGYFSDIQVQPHACVPNAEKRWNAIRERMKATHRLTFDAQWCWSNWEIIQ